MTRPSRVDRTGAVKGDGVGVRLDDRGARVLGTRLGRVPARWSPGAVS